MKPILVPYDENMTKEELLKAIADAVGSDVETVKKELCEPKEQSDEETDLLVKTPQKSRESHEKNCETCRDKDTYDEWEGNCDECKNGSMYTPQTDSEVTRNSLRTDCTGCKFVGWYDTDFPCANCVRKNKDYYTAEQTDCDTNCTE